jgi:hypothetical protein
MSYHSLRVPYLLVYVLKEVLGCDAMQLVDGNLVPYYSTLKMEVVVSFETFVPVFHTIRAGIAQSV